MKHSLKTQINLGFLFVFSLSILIFTLLFWKLSRAEKQIEQESSKTRLVSIIEAQLPVITYDLVKGAFTSLRLRNELVTAAHAPYGLGIAIYDKNRTPIYRSERAPLTSPDFEHPEVVQSDRDSGLKIFYPVRMGLETLGYAEFSIRCDEHGTLLLQKGFFVTILSISLSFLVLFSLVRWQIMRRIYSPIDSLSQLIPRMNTYLTCATERPLIPTPSGSREIDELGGLIVRNANLLKDTLAEREKLKTQQLRDEAINRVAAQVSHDIRSPLTALSVLSDEIKKSDVPPQQMALLRASVERIQQIAEDLLTQRRENPLAVSTTSLPNILGPLVTEKQLTTGKNAKLAIRTDIDPVFYRSNITAVPAQLTRVLSNLINNAIEASTDGAGEIVVSARPTAENFCEISVRDSGCGIEPSDLAAIRGFGITIGKQNGNGLGLSYAKAKAAEWGGNLQLESSPGVGTLVSLRLPLHSPR